jgi:DNA-binding MarR family transcriptional regulator
MRIWTSLDKTWTAVHKLLEHSLAQVDLTPEQFQVLLVCDELDGATPAVIARRMFREGQSVAQLLNRMERLGLVVRDRKRKGQPYTLVRMTAKGEDVLSGAKPIVSAELGAVGGFDYVDRLDELLQTMCSRAWYLFVSKKERRLAEKILGR